MNAIVSLQGIAPNSRSYTALIHAYAEGRWHQKAAKDIVEHTRKCRACNLSDSKGRSHQRNRSARIAIA